MADGKGVLLVVGLGNPGIEYQFTPHNAGFLAIDRIAESHGATVANRRGKALTAKVRIAGRETILAKPETFMNLSGLSVAALAEEFGVDPRAGRSEDLIVLYDELALPLGAMRIRDGGSAAGHNGAKSINASLRTEDWARIRIGVGPDASPESAYRRGKDYLLSPLRKADLATLAEVLDKAEQAVETFAASGIKAAMNEFNRRDNPPAA
ncbi:aminoacyl-tRNA hydrolase [Silvibacterium dinghuense]|uniref:Peptidyl-tRNA hydrolase n=1 Tax=Silvibacterium dinghuense TaxID=1560006 RepID=A0A4V1NUX6_9BACT|nr:aminoacyl-tRNA hydrolase [Silvibacterium dinghuense]RXS93784.1 aminoacyl-tRNA hydrolase [Silvibacterium dinghuense]GGH07606.1 peptidyl-tRNA hydrolase [Silvibacterium dinghuense]